ncbi:MAG: hypothetical protein ACLSG5_08075 [Oscillospiraceae bacterium]
MIYFDNAASAPVLECAESRRAVPVGMLRESLVDTFRGTTGGSGADRSAGEMCGGCRRGP